MMDGAEMKALDQPRSTGAGLLRNESAFLLCSSDEEETTEPVRGHKALSSSTQFELSTRPTTAIPAHVMTQFGDRMAASKEIGNDEIAMDEAAAIEDCGEQELRHSNSSFSSFVAAPDETVSNDLVQDDPFAVHVVVEDGGEPMQCMSPPMDSNMVNDSVLTVHEVSSDDDDAELAEQEVGDEEAEWKQISDVDRDNVASLRSAFAELSKEDAFAVTVVEEDDSGSDEHRAPDDEVEKVSAVKHEESKERDEESEEEYEEDFEETEQEMGGGGGSMKQRAVFRLPELDSSINNFQSKVYSVYSSFDDTLMSHSVASSSDLNHGSPEQFKTACKTILE